MYPVLQIQVSPFALNSTATPETAQLPTFQVLPPHDHEPYVPVRSAWQMVLATEPVHTTPVGSKLPDNLTEEYTVLPEREARQLFQAVH